MKCPRCKSALEIISYELAMIESCPGCGGEWLGPNELKHIVQTFETVFPKELKDSLAGINSQVFPTKRVVKKDLTCPRCQDVVMNNFNYAYSSGVYIDKCPECSGIWLDEGELEKIQILVEQWRSKARQDNKIYAPLISPDRFDPDGFVRKVYDFFYNDDYDYCDDDSDILHSIIGYFTEQD